MNRMPQQQWFEIVIWLIFCKIFSHVNDLSHEVMHKLHDYNHFFLFESCFETEIIIIDCKLSDDVLHIIWDFVPETSEYTCVIQPIW